MTKDRKPPVASEGGMAIIIQQPDGSTKLTYTQEEYKFAFELRNAARFMANSAKSLEETSRTHYHNKAFIHAAIMLSYASLEAAINEILHIHALTERSPLTESERNTIYSITQGDLVPKKNNHTLGMFNMILRVIGKPEINSGDKTYQNADLVRSLRNMIVHPIPGKVMTFTELEDYDYSSQQEIVKKLRAPLGLNRSATFPKDVMTKECANWAVSSCETFLHTFLEISKIDIGFITKSN